MALSRVHTHLNTPDSFHLDSRIISRENNENLEKCPVSHY